MDITFWLLVVGIAIGLIDLILGLLRTYYAKYAKKTFIGSVKYWTSWKERKFDVARQVLEEMGIDSAEDIKKLARSFKKSKRKKKN